eukprot:5670604-Alexandrium_andersonii.AAC.1
MAQLQSRTLQSWAMQVPTLSSLRLEQRILALGHLFRAPQDAPRRQVAMDSSFAPGSSRDRGDRASPGGFGTYPAVLGE